MEMDINSYWGRRLDSRPEITPIRLYIWYGILRPVKPMRRILSEFYPAHMHIELSWRVAGYLYRGAIASIAPDRRRNFQKPRQERARIRYAGKRAFPIHQSAPGRIRVRFARLFPSTS